MKKSQKTIKNKKSVAKKTVAPAKKATSKVASSKSLVISKAKPNVYTSVKSVTISTSTPKTKKIVPTSKNKKDIQPDSQYNVILNHLVKNGSIHTMEAINSYGVLRLGAVIHNLRQGGMDIKTSVHTFKSKGGRTSNVAKYILQS